jgi:hypothetical protein
MRRDSSTKTGQRGRYRVKESAGLWQRMRDSINKTEDREGRGQEEGRRGGTVSLRHRKGFKDRKMASSIKTGLLLKRRNRRG